MQKSLMLADRILQHIKSTIHHDQMEFISEIQYWFKIEKSLNIIYHIHKIRGKMTIFSANM